jgi:hypothetical protein
MNASTYSHSTIFKALLLGLLLLLPLCACSSEPPALTIGEVEFGETDLLGFTGDRRTRLAEITALGVAVSRGEGTDLGQPLVARRTQVYLLEALEREVALRLAGVEEEALRARYDTVPDYELSVRHLVILVDEWASEEEEERAHSAAREALARIQGGEDFAQVAAEVSEEPGAQERGGLLRPGRKGSWVDEFWNTASSLEVGEVSQVIRTQFGYHVLKLEGRTPLPFSEARDRVVEEVANLLPPQDAEIEAWMDSVAAALTVDTATVTRFWEEAGSLFTLAQRTLKEEGDSSPLAHWDGGEFTAAQLSSFLLSLQRPSWQHVRVGGLPELLRVTAEGARRALLEGVASGMGVEIPQRDRELFQQEWDQTVAGWAAGLGFREGMTPDQVKGAALEAVSSTAQGVTIARQEIQGWAPLLLSAYPIGPEEG